MKKFILLVGLLLCMCACHHQENQYSVTIVYTIGAGGPITETYRINLRENSVPGYVYDGRCLKIIYAGKTGHSTLAGTYGTVYEGQQPVQVMSFDYKVVRTFTASDWDGHEIKEKNK